MFAMWMSYLSDRSDYVWGCGLWFPEPSSPLTSNMFFFPFFVIFHKYNHIYINVNVISIYVGSVFQRLPAHWRLLPRLWLEFSYSPTITVTEHWNFFHCILEIFFHWKFIGHTFHSTILLFKNIFSACDDWKLCLLWLLSWGPIDILSYH